VHGSWPGGFNTQVVVKNTGSTPISGWRLRWSFLSGQHLDDVWSADAEQTGATVTATNLSWNATIAPGRSVTFGFIGANPGGPNPVPALFTLNGSACSWE
jgi:endoglucanase